MIELKDINKVFKDKNQNEFYAAKDVNLKINDGEIFGIIGFSGAGKSTVVRCINLLGRPTSGQVIVNEKNLLELSAKELREERKKIGMIFQHFNLMPSRTVFENIAFPLKHSGLSKKQVQEKVRELLTLVELADKESQYPSQLSGGQKQRVAVARPDQRIRQRLFVRVQRNLHRPRQLRPRQIQAVRFKRIYKHIPERNQT